jgi:hypothetical protein
LAADRGRTLDLSQCTAVVGPFERDGRAIWTAVDRLIDATPDLVALKANRIHLLAARRWGELGREIPPELEADVRRSVLRTLLVPEVLSHVRAAHAGLVLHKGPEIAQLYRDAASRPFIDLDVLAPDAAAAQEALLAAGFVEVGDPTGYVATPHRQPVEWPGLPIHVEVHAGPNWPSWLGRPPQTAELFDRVVPSSLGVDGLQTLAPEQHALVVAVHAWAHGPLAQVRDLVDVALMADGLDREELRKLARRWGVEGLWQTTVAAADAVLFGAPKPRALRVWARNLPAVRERTVFETHLARWFAGFSALGVRRGAGVMRERIAVDIRPKNNETWLAKLKRSRRALRNARLKKSQHDEGLDERVGRR